MSGRSVKNRGTNYEYRIANWFQEQKGWNGLRNPLSGASEQIEDSVGKHDVRAWNEERNIFLQVEAKKRGNTKKGNQIEILRKWIDKIDFFKDEILVFATNRSPHYVLLPLKRYFQILGRTYHIDYDEKKQWFKGEKQFVFKRENIDNSEDKKFHLIWGPDKEEWVIIYLEDFIMLRETIDLEDDLSFEDRIKKITSIDKAEKFEKDHLDELNYKQKKLLYQKLEQLQDGSLINPKMLAEEQFWLNDEAFICICPHCESKIIKGDLKKEDNSEV